MADKNTAGAAGRAPEVDRPDKIRNVVLVGPSGSGKTTLVEQLLVAAGALTRAGRVEDGTTVSDFDEAEVRQQRSVGLALAPLEVDGIKVNLVDTPGYADFVGDLRAGLRAADAALFVIGATDGVDGATQLLWDECAAVGMPRAVVVTKLDKERADFDETVAVCQRLFGGGVLPLYLPMHKDDGTVGGLIGLLSQQVYDYSSGSRAERAPDAEHLPLIENSRGTLIEGSSPRARTRPSWTATSAARTSTSTPSSPTSRRRSRAARSTRCSAPRRRPSASAPPSCSR
ncbi:MAG: GTP-binding protein [Candidatus Nanopelagicales bacterium]